METVTQVAKHTGISVRTLHHYDAIGLLKPTQITQAGYRLYDEAALERLHLILLFRECGLSLEEIRQLLDSPDSDRESLLAAQSILLKEKIHHLQNCLHLATAIKETGVNNLKGNRFDPKTLDSYSTQAQALYGKTEAYREYTEKAAGRTKEREQALGGEIMAYFIRLGELKHLSPADDDVQSLIGQLRDFITQHYYNCTPPILRGLGQLYAAGGTMTENIDAAGGAGTGEFTRQAIEIYCEK